MCPKLIFLFNSVLNMKQTKAMFKFLLLVFVTGLMRQSSSLTANRRTTGKLFTARTHFINHFCSAALKRKHLRADRAKSICMTVIERPPKGLLKQKVRSVRIEQAEGAKIQIASVSTLLLAFLTLSQVQNNRIPCSCQNRRRLTGVESERIKLDKASGQLIHPLCSSCQSPEKRVWSLRCRLKEHFVSLLIISVDGSILTDSRGSLLLKIDEGEVNIYFQREPHPEHPASVHHQHMQPILSPIMLCVPSVAVQ